MSRGVNKVILLGNIGKDPEIKVQGDFTVAKTSLATSEKWKDKKTGEDKEQVQWHNIVFYNKLAEIVGQYVKKGSKIYVEGKLVTRKWQDKDTGVDRYATDIICNEMQMLDSKPASADGYKHDVNHAPVPDDGRDDLDDEIPF